MTDIQDMNLRRFKNRFLRAAGRTEGTVTLPQAKPGLREAAVLVLVFPGRDGLEVLLTRRGDGLLRHAGQISFPGGTLDPEDEDYIAAALREAREEVGLDSAPVEVLGTLDSIVSRTGFVVVPVLAVTDSPQQWRPEPGEVEAVFSVPLKLMLETERYRLDSLVRKGIKSDFYYIDYDEHYIWGITAAILRSLALALNAPSRPQV